jgi:hypothetical protein
MPILCILILTLCIYNYIILSYEYIFVKSTLCFISQVCKVDQATLHAWTQFVYAIAIFGPLGVWQTLSKLDCIH